MPTLRFLHQRTDSPLLFYGTLAAISMQHVRNKRRQVRQLGIDARSLDCTGYITELILDLHNLVVRVEPMPHQFHRLHPIEQ